MRRLIVVGLVAMMAAALFWWYRGRDTRGPLVLAGTVEARDVEVGSLVGGRVLSVGVEEGATVEAKQVIVTLEPDLLDLQIKEQQGRVGAAQAALDRAVRGPRTEQVTRAQVDYEVAERERRRLEALRGQGVIGEQDYDDAAARAAAAFQTMRELQRGSRREDLDEAHANLETATGQLMYLQRQREELTVRAPASGVVETFDLRPGDIVQAGQPVARLLEPDQLWVRVFVPETRLGQVSLGQGAGVVIDTFPGRRFAGKVIEIRPRGEFLPRNIQTVEQRADQVFGVKVAIDKTPEIKAGMAAVVHLEASGGSAGG